MKKFRMRIVKVVAWVTDVYHIRRAEGYGSYPAYTAYINTYFLGFLISSVQIRDIEPYQLEIMLGDNAEIKPLK